MKVAFLLNTNVFEESSASANRWKNIISGLSNNGVETVLFVVGGYQNRTEKSNKFIYEDCDIVYLDSTTYDGIWKRRLRVYAFDKILVYLQAKELQKALKNKQIHSLFLNGANEVLKVYDMAFKGKPASFKLLFEMNEDPQALDVHATNYLQRKKLDEQKRLLEKRIFKDTDYYFFMTRNLMVKYADYIKSTDHEIHLLPMSVDMTRFESLVKNNKNDFYIAYCGSSSFHKDGVDILIKAFDILAKRNVEIKLKIAAFWENDGNKMMSLIDNAECKRIEYVGELSKNDIPQFIKNAGILVLPRPRSEQAKYGFPTKLGEYLATGNPVCSTKVGEISNYLEDRYSVFFAEPDSVDSLVLTLEEIIANLDKAREVGLNGRLSAMKYFDKEKQGEFLKGVLIDRE
jgi:glycosyltransferase involved in cell wall biosynthesis